MSKHQYYYWNLWIREKQKTDEEMTFTDITSIFKKTDTARANPVLFSDFQIFFNGIRVTVPSNFNPAALAGLKFKLDPHSGTNVFLFCNKRRNSLRALRWDGNRFILVTKALSEEIKFQWPKNQGEVCEITRRQLEWLLEGLQIDQKKAHTDSINTSGMIF